MGEQAKTAWSSLLPSLLLRPYGKKQEGPSLYTLSLRHVPRLYCEWGNSVAGRKPKLEWVRVLGVVSLHGHHQERTLSPFFGEALFPVTQLMGRASSHHLSLPPLVCGCGCKIALPCYRALPWD